LNVNDFSQFNISLRSGLKIVLSFDFKDNLISR